MFAHRLRVLREGRDYTLDDVANLIGVHRSQIIRWESGKIPNAESVVKLARAFGVSTDYLLGLVDREQDTLKEAQLSTGERQLLDALRNGALHKALEVMLAMTSEVHTP